MSAFAESIVEDATLGWLQAIGYEIKHGPDIAAGEPGASTRGGERQCWNSRKCYPKSGQAHVRQRFGEFVSQDPALEPISSVFCAVTGTFPPFPHHDNPFFPDL